MAQAVQTPRRLAVALETNLVVAPRTTKAVASRRGV